MLLPKPVLFLVLSSLTAGLASSSSPNLNPIDRHALVSRYNPVRNTTEAPDTPLQVGNGNFAFGADITGLQTLYPFAIMSSWGWKNDSFPPGVSIQDILAWEGTQLDTHGRMVDYAFSDGVDPVGSWLISNPNRVNLGRIALTFLNRSMSPDDLTEPVQTLDLWTGTLTSRFTLDSAPVTVETWCSRDSDTVGVRIDSPLLPAGRLGVSFEFPWNDGSSKFEAPFVGSFSSENSSLHTTKMTLRATKGAAGGEAEIKHTLGQNAFYTMVQWEEQGMLTGDEADQHRYTLIPSGSSGSFSFSATYALSPEQSVPSVAMVTKSSEEGWEDFWSTGGFVDLVTGSAAEGADELQRRIILSQYLLAVNEAGDTSPQESGLVNNGWYGKFHLEMVFWHMAHWSLWSKQSILDGATTLYSRFLSTSLERAQKQQGYAAGARWGKMSDPSGRSAPGEINALLIWQQPHPIFFAELEYRTSPSISTLNKWNEVVEATADFMAAFAWWNESTGVYDLGPPMYPVSENTDPSITVNPTFELAYWTLGLDLAGGWWKRQGKEPKEEWTHVRNNLAPLPTDGEGRYVVYEGLDASMWSDPNLTSDHPALLGVCGWLPPINTVNLTIAAATAEQVKNTWNISDSYGWDMPLLAMSAARLGNPTEAVQWLLHPLFQFDDVGMPIGGVRVPTPYFPASGGLLYAVAMMAAGWDGEEGGKNAPGFPEGWNVRYEELRKAI